MKYSFSGHSALVTGATSGIGAATARLLAANGLSVVVSGRNRSALDEVVKDIEKAGGKAVAKVTDVTKPDQVKELVDCAIENFGALHFAVNNAGILGGSKPVGELELDDWHSLIDTNLNGVAYGLRYQIPAILAAGGGAVVNMSSIMGLVSNARLPGYNAAKHGVVGLSRAAALEYSSKGLRINTIHPGYVDTPILSDYDEAARADLVTQHPIGRLGHSDEIAHTIAFLLSEGASFMTGACLVADGGYTAR